MNVHPISGNKPHVIEDDLSALACTSENSRGRRIPEPPPSHRTEFQRDRDRVIHCSAFRRLEYKTQVFANHEGDMFRTRLTHSLEVAQVARTIARALNVNEDLTEAISLAHDLGHTPFGHAGQDALNLCMADFGGFEHNAQSLRVVDELESRYLNFNGLNLLFETREGILKHCSVRRARQLGAVGERILNKRAPSIEAQIANLADEIAYNHHDIDDGLRARMLSPEILSQSRLFKDIYQSVVKAHPRANEQVIKHTVLREMLSVFVNDLIDASRERYLSVKNNPASAGFSTEIVGFSATIKREHLALKKLLFEHLYRHPKIEKNNNLAKEIVSRLFDYFASHPGKISDMGTTITADTQADLFVKIADYIAGMTDRFAVTAYNELFD
ncbi:MAG: deoxyguanosinetriphosphate triphosphohydrolase [Gammaproteobacteria bacterium]